MFLFFLFLYPEDDQPNTIPPRRDHFSNEIVLHGGDDVVDGRTEEEWKAAIYSANSLKELQYLATVDPDHLRFRSVQPYYQYKYRILKACEALSQAGSLDELAKLKKLYIAEGLYEEDGAITCRRLVLAKRNRKLQLENEEKRRKT